VSTSLSDSRGICVLEVLSISRRTKHVTLLDRLVILEASRRLSRVRLSSCPCACPTLLLFLASPQTAARFVSTLRLAIDMQTCVAMLEPTPASRHLSRLLRYKAEEGKPEGYWGADLEKANNILHDRIWRKERDKLCSGCARFDWLRTGFYTRDVIDCNGNPIDESLFFRSEDIQSGSTKDGMPLSFRPRSLQGLKDDVPWNQFAAVDEGKEEHRLLADHPRFNWELEGGASPECTLCMNIVKPFERGLDLGETPVRLTVELLMAPFLAKSLSHKCLDVR
jgi:hypothetical protein